MPLSRQPGVIVKGHESIEPEQRKAVRDHLREWFNNLNGSPNSGYQLNLP